MQNVAIDLKETSHFCLKLRSQTVERSQIMISHCTKFMGCQAEMAGLRRSHTRGVTAELKVFVGLRREMKRCRPSGLAVSVTHIFLHFVPWEGAIPIISQSASFPFLFRTLAGRRVSVKYRKASPLTLFSPLLFQNSRKWYILKDHGL